MLQAFGTPKRLDAYHYVGFWMWDIGTDTLQADENVCDYFSVAREAGRSGVPLRSFLAGIHAEDRPRVARRIRHAIETGRAFNETYRVSSRSLGLRWIEANGICFRGPDGRPQTYPGIVIDVTDGQMAYPHAMMVEKLVEARAYAQFAESALLTSLIEAVLLEAGRKLAEALKENRH